MKKQFKLLSSIATAFTVSTFWACGDFSANLEGEAVLNYGTGTNSVLTCNEKLDGKVVKPSSGDEYRLCKNGQWFAIEIEDFDEKDLVNPNEKSSSSEATLSSSSKKHTVVFEDDEEDQVPPVKSSSSKAIVDLFDDDSEVSSSSNKTPEEILFVCEDGKTFVENEADCPKIQEIVKPSTTKYNCGEATSCWIVMAEEKSKIILDFAFGIVKENDFKVESLDSDWYTTVNSAFDDCVGWGSLPKKGAYRLIVNNWEKYTSISYMQTGESQGFFRDYDEEGFFGSIYAIDFWSKNSWNITLKEVYSLPTVIFNCENLEEPPVFTSSVTGALSPYIEAMEKTCPNVKGNSSLQNCTKAIDYEDAKKLHPSWF